MQLDRRMRRTSDPVLALEFFLESELERRGARAITLGTLDGLAIAGCGDVEPTLVAAVGASKLMGLSEHPLVAGFCDEPMNLTVVEARGERLLITAIGGTDAPGQAEAHVVRILS